MKDAARILVSVPNWVGDVVMATPALRAIRRQFSTARIVHLMRPYVAEVLAGTCFGDEQVFWPRPRGEREGPEGLLDLVRRLRGERFDLAILLTNSFRSALVTRLAGAGRRVGYARDGRSWLLTDGVKPRRGGRKLAVRGPYIPVAAPDYYNELARYVGCPEVEERLELATSPADEAAIDRRLGPVDPGRPLVVLNPGASFGSAKCWPAEHYAEVADTLVRRRGARVVATLGPKEQLIAERLKAAVSEPIDVFADPPLGLGPLKALIRRCRLLITNDTGPRHFAAAFDVPVVTVFGSSDPAWTDTRFAKERAVMLDLDCQPCMKRTCPLKHHRCMRELPPAMVTAGAEELLSRFGAPSPAVSQPCS
jgi:heptosyltransferase-2